jgi:hypothetical protein
LYCLERTVARAHTDVPWEAYKKPVVMTGLVMLCLSLLLMYPPAVAAGIFLFPPPPDVE